MDSTKKTSTHDYLIVGAGLVGRLLARRLSLLGQAVAIASDPDQPGASRVAAWMINPVTGIRFVPSWRVETFLPAAIALYRELEREIGLKIWHPLPIHRLFQGDDELPRWEKKRLRPEILRFVTEETTNPPGIHFHSGGWADIGPWLQRPSPGIEVLIGKVDRSELEKSRFSWQGRIFSRVIFCTGYASDRSRAGTEPRSPSLPWKPAKGELLTVRIAGLDLKVILLRGIFVIPLGGDLYRVGATYEWDDLSADCTEKGRDFLLTKLAALVDLPFEIIDSQTAIRPILQDARPVLGLEKNDPRFGLCNGFGSKAALMAPAVCEHFADHLVHDIPLDPEMSLERLPRSLLSGTSS